MEKTENVDTNVEDLKGDETKEYDTKNSAAGNNMEEEDDDEDTKDDDTEDSNDDDLLKVLSKLADSLEKDNDMAGGDSKRSNPLDSDFALFSPSTLVGISEGVDTTKKSDKSEQFEERMKDG